MHDPDLRPPPVRVLACSVVAVLIAGCGIGGRGAPADPPLPPLDTAVSGEVTSGEVGEDYTLGSDDQLSVRVFGAPDLSGEFRVTSGGEISIPLLGSVQAGGLTAGELETAIEDGLRGTYMWDPQVSVQVLEARSHVVSTVYVLGDVRRPGGYPLERGEPISVIQALAIAEGLEPTAAAGHAKIIREHSNGEREEVRVDLQRVLAGEANDPLLRHRDILFVPNSRSRSVAQGIWGAFVRVFTFRGILY